jgi:hypothetical protein
MLSCVLYNEILEQKTSPVFFACDRERAGAIPLVDGGIVEHNHNATGGPIKLQVSAKFPQPTTTGGWTSNAKNVFVRH